MDISWKLLEKDLLSCKKQTEHAEAVLPLSLFLMDVMAPFGQKIC